MSTSAGSHNLDPTNKAPTSKDQVDDRDRVRAQDREPVVGTEDRETVIDREKGEHGGMKIGSAFFGWLTATGMAVILTAVFAGIVTAVGASTDTTVDQATKELNADLSAASLAGAIALGVVLFIAYYCGGYVAGRMARFDGAKQGVAVWLWALIIAIAVAVLAAVAGDQYNVLSQINSFPQIPIAKGNQTTVGIITAGAIALITLLAAVLGGLAGMRFHRKVDKTGLGG